LATPEGCARRSTTLAAAAPIGLNSAIGAPSIPRPDIRTGLAGADEPLALKSAVIFGQHISKALDRALPLIQRASAQTEACVLHRLGDGFIVAFGEPISGK
jgi:hypothetical protein